MREHEARFVIEHARKRGKSPLRAVREHLGLTREVLAGRVRFDPRCLAACEDHEGVAMPDIRFRRALARCLGVPADLLFEPRRRTA
jgi:ribosome-binding protein aMBF1 (putative translation factor)